MADIFERRDLSYAVPIRARFGTTVCRLVGTGLGIAVIDQFTVAHDAVPGIRLLDIDGPTSFDTYVAVKAERGLSTSRSIHRPVEGGNDGGCSTRQVTSCSFERISWYLTLMARLRNSCSTE